MEIDQNNKITVYIDPEKNQGDQFDTTTEDAYEVHEILGFLVGTDEAYMYSQVMNHPDGLHYVNKWVSKGHTLWGFMTYELLKASDYTVLDMIAHYDRVKGI